MKRYLTRRTLLRGAGGLGLSLPLLESLGCSREKAMNGYGQTQQKSTFPKRLLIWYTPNGNFDLPPTFDFGGTYFDELTPFKQKMLMLRGLDYAVHNVPPGEPHQTGMAWMTGRPLNEGNFVGGDGSLAGWASGISLDQHLAKLISGTTPHKSLHLGVQSTAYGGTEVRTVMSYTGSDAPVSNETNPYSLFDLVFKDLGADPEELKILKARRKSVLDVAVGRFGKLKPKLSASDRAKLDQHLTSLKEVEDKLSKPGIDIGGNCNVPALVSPQVNLDDPASFPFIGGMFIDMAAMAFACDLTRVITLQWSASTNNRPYPWLKYDDGSGAGPMPIQGDEHVLGHQSDSDATAWGKLRTIKKWYMQQMKALLTKLDSIPEGEGTLLDNTVVVWCSEITRGNTHSHMDTPFFLFGSGGGYFKTGRDLTFSAGDVPHNNLLVSLANAMGDPITSFGDPGFCTGPLTELVG